MSVRDSTGGFFDCATRYTEVGIPDDTSKDQRNLRNAVIGKMALHVVTRGREPC